MNMKFSPGLSAAVLALLASYQTQVWAGDIRTPLFCTPNTLADWPALTPLNRAIQPMDCGIIDHNPPILAWQNITGATGYEVRLVNSAGVATTYITTYPWYQPTNAMATGDYTWSVRAKGATAWGVQRKFRIAANARDFTLPSVETALARAKATVRPRAMPPLGAERTAWLNDLAGQRALGWTGLRKRVLSKLTDVLPVEPASASKVAGAATAEAATANLAFMNQMNKLTEAARESAALAWVEKDPNVIADAKRRLLHLARLDPQGTTSWAAEGLSAHRTVWTITNAYDWLLPYLTASEQAECVASIKGRVPDMLKSLTDVKEGIIAKPLDSWAIDTMQATLAISAIMAGTVPEAETWFRALYPIFPAWLNPWGGDDGGFANGTNYLIWALESQENWDIIRWTTGVDITKKSWTRNLGRGMVYFYPPGSPFGLFGDGATSDNTEPNGRLFKPYAARINDPLYNWYAGQQTGGDTSRLQYLLAPPLSSQPSLPAGTPNAIWQPSTGWAAMHSSLADRARTSVYFKSSQYGSYGHGHADQNSFTINAKGRALAIETGVYDYYGSSIYIGWSKTTAAHNAITYDGGKGQGQGSNGKGDVLAAGTITAFSTTDAVDIVQGDATKAYGGDVTKANRSVVYVRPAISATGVSVPGMVLVFDTLAASTAKKWEWNIHGVAAPSVFNANSLVLKNVDTSLCAVVRGDTVLVPSEFLAPTNATPTVQWHGRYSVGTAVTKATFAAAMQVDCGSAAVPVPAPQTDGSWVVSTAAWKVTYKDGVANYAALK